MSCSCEDYPCCGHTDGPYNWQEKDNTMQDWYKTASGNECPWCEDESSEFEPMDSDDADMNLCRGHVAEFEGLSIDGLDRADAEMAKDFW